MVYSLSQRYRYYTPQQSRADEKARAAISCSILATILLRANLKLKLKNDPKALRTACRPARHVSMVFFTTQTRHLPPQHQAAARQTHAPHNLGRRVFIQPPQPLQPVSHRRSFTSPCKTATNTQQATICKEKVYLFTCLFCIFSWQNR